jgi:predicted HTH transcriptional regulator
VAVLNTLEDIRALKETWQVECKLANGRDGSGALPEDIWETYSAFANTQGGEILLGLRELGPGRYELAGIANVKKVLAELHAGLEDRSRVSANLLTPDSIRQHCIEGKCVIEIKVPKAPLALRPVYLGADPLRGSYVRSQSFDIRLTPDRVRRIQARVRSELLQKA